VQLDGRLTKKSVRGWNRSARPTCFTSAATERDVDIDPESFTLACRPSSGSGPSTKHHVSPRASVVTVGPAEEDNAPADAVVGEGID
jgi:hypothetical protein